MITNVGVAIHGGFLGYPNGTSAVHSPDGAFNNTILTGAQTGGNKYHVVLVENPDDVPGPVTIDGFKIIDGEAGAPHSTSNVFLSDSGGGILSIDTDLTLENLTIRDNTATSSGGGVYFTSVFGGCAFPASTSRTLKMEKCRVRNNTCIIGSGGGVYISPNSDALLVNDRIRNNVAAGMGGGIFIAAEGRTVLAANLVLNDNTAAEGGAIKIRPTLAGFTTEWDNCTIAYNKLHLMSTGAGGVDIDHSGAIHTFQNCILYFNGAPDLEVKLSPPLPNNVFVDHCDLGTSVGLFNLASSLSVDPMFVNPPGRNLHLQGDPLLGFSPCINAGLTSFLPCDFLDIDEDGVACGILSEPLPLDFDLTMRAVNAVDMGAYEHPIGIQ